MELKDKALTLEVFANEMAAILDDIGFKSGKNDFEMWLAYKSMEKYATDKRREIEETLLDILNLPVEGEGSQTIKDNDYKVKVTYRMNRTINADLLQEIAAESGLTEHLGSLFRWKPDINAKAWKDAAPEITTPLLDAITTRPGRPSFTIEPIESKDDKQS